MLEELDEGFWAGVGNAAKRMKRSKTRALDTIESPECDPRRLERLVVPVADAMAVVYSSALLVIDPGESTAVAR